jgi:hypothetical protein
MDYEKHSNFTLMQIEMEDAKEILVNLSVHMLH